MVLGGFNKKLLDDLGVSYRCLVNEPAIFKEAKEKGITRSMAAVEYAAKVDGPIYENKRQRCNGGRRLLFGIL